MKTNRTLFSVAITALFLFSSDLVNAQTSAKPHYVSTQPSGATEMTFDVDLLKDAQAGRFILAVENPEALRVNITVESAAGLAYQSELSSLSFRKRFDLSTKKDGDYTVIVDTGRRTYKKTVNISTGSDSVRALTIK
jgi:hypothetical protein